MNQRRDRIQRVEKKVWMQLRAERLKLCECKLRFELRGSELVTRGPMVPIMMTTNATVAAIDCLFYAAREG